MHITLCFRVWPKHYSDVTQKPCVWNHRQPELTMDSPRKGAIMCIVLWRHYNSICDPFIVQILTKQPKNSFWILWPFFPFRLNLGEVECNASHRTSVISSDRCSLVRLAWWLEIHSQQHFLLTSKETVNLNQCRFSVLSQIIWPRQ